MKAIIGLVCAVFVTAIVISTPTVQASDVPNTKKVEDKFVVVVEGDNLTLIAENNQTTYQRIFFANTNIADPDIIDIGQKLRIPRADEQLTERVIPENVVAVTPIAVGSTYGQSATPAYTPTAPATNYATGDGSVWDKLAQCESGGNWAINTGNGYYGGLQFTPSSWTAAGGSGLPQNTSREEQIRVATNLQAMQGWGAWPACSAKLGL